MYTLNLSLNLSQIIPKTRTVVDERALSVFYLDFGLSPYICSILQSLM